MSLKGVTSEDGQGVQSLAGNKEGEENLCLTFFLSAKKRQCKHHMTGKENLNVKPERVWLFNFLNCDWLFQYKNIIFFVGSVLDGTVFLGMKELPF